MSDDRAFEEFFAPRRPVGAESGGYPPSGGERLGIVVGGSLSRGLEVKLDRATVIEGVTVGRYVVIESRGFHFFGMITDVALDHTNPMLAKTPPDISDPFLAEIYAGTGVYGRLTVSPMLVWKASASHQASRVSETVGSPASDDTWAETKPVKSLPSHFALVRNATEADVSRVFGDKSQGDKRYFHVGEPLDMEGIKLYLDLDRFVERSSGVFGKSGTGKTFLTRLLLAGIIRSEAAVNLVFDMHNEYGWESIAEDKTRVKGLKQLFPSRVAIFTLDDESSRRRGIRPDFVVQISYEQIEAQDIEMLSGLLGLSEAAVGTIYFLHKHWGQGWLQRLMDISSTEVEQLVHDYGQHAGTISALVRRLRVLERFDFLRPQAESPSVQRILEYLQKGIHVILEFGRYGSSLEAYILVANYLTRRIHEAYVRRKEAALGNRAEEPRPLVITIEEAHKFLDPQIARQTIFGTIARELRKYNVTLLVVDQRPSGIDEEVMSQIGTRVTCLLDNERDIQAVLTGISGAGELREVLARLDTRQQALLLGHAVAMPVVIRTRTYGTSEFYESLLASANHPADTDQDLEASEEDASLARLEANRRLLRGE